MSAFDELGSAYLGPVLADHHGDDITLHPRNGSSRPVKGIVTRELAELNEAVPSGHPVPRATIDIRADSSLGATAAELDRGTWEVEFALERPGGHTERHPIADFTDAVGGMLTLIIQ